MAQRPGIFPESDLNAALSLFQHIKARFPSDPDVYEKFLRLLRGYYRTGETHDSSSVTDQLYELLQGDPDLVRRLDAFFPAPEPAREDPAPTRLKRERRPTADAIDDDTRRTLMYLERVRRRGAGLYDRLLALIIELESEKTLDGNQIYELARAVFGSEHRDLLREFTEYLPIPTGRERNLLLRRRAKKVPAPVPVPEEHHAPPPKRKAAAVAVDNPSPEKRPHNDDRKTTKRRANSSAAAPKSGGVSAFREAWEFETTYSKMVVTMRRIEELLKEYKPTKDAPAPPRGRRSFDELFPSRECQEVIREMYHNKLGLIRAALEDDKRTELALRTIERRLGMREQVAVKVAMERRDSPRVEGRMSKLAVDKVLVLRKNQAKQIVSA